MELVSTIFTMESAITEGKMGMEQQELAGAGEALRGKQEELSMRERMLEAAATIHAQGTGAGITAESGTLQVSQQQAAKRGKKEIITTRSGTKQRILERQMKGAQARTRGYAKATGAGMKFVSDSMKRGSIA